MNQFRQIRSDLFDQAKQLQAKGESKIEVVNTIISSILDNDSLDAVELLCLIRSVTKDLDYILSRPDD